MLLPKYEVDDTVEMPKGVIPNSVVKVDIVLNTRITIIAAILKVEGTGPEGKIRFIPLYHTSTKALPIPLRSNSGNLIVLNVRWFYTENWKRVYLL